MNHSRATVALLAAAMPWSVQTYPDEAALQKRIAATVPALAKLDYGKRSLALSKCPDTGLPVRTWAVQGDPIISPYTGRQYVQGETGYFGPKLRDAQGRIFRFGGDPLKYDLPPCTARMLLDPNDAPLRAFLAIPGNLNQQYHFACVNWARFHGLAADRMGEPWKRDFAAAVAAYREGRLPSDGPREHVASAPFSHDLVGEENEFFGGRASDGGTENHKTMWRTSGLLYSQILGPDARVSGHAAPEAERITSKVLARGWQDILKVGNGEWDSSSYYPFHVRGFLNLYDFSPKEETRDLARFALDYYFATYGLKVLNGNFAGAQKRGYVSGFGMGAMDLMCWAFVARTNQPVAPEPVLTIHQATTKYRPNRVLCNIIAKNVPLPFEARMARPTYHLRDRNACQETFYCDGALALGSVAMTMEDNPTQQTVWSLACRAAAGNLIFGGGQPKFRSPEGHSRHTQVVQKRSSLAVLTAGKDLELLADGLSNEQRWEKAPAAAETWLFVPRGAKVVFEDRERILIDAGEAWVLVRPIGRTAWMKSAAPASTQPDKKASLAGTLAMYDILVVSGRGSGYVVDAALKKTYAGQAAILKAAGAKPLEVAAEPAFRARYATLAGDTVEVRHEPADLRASASINGKAVDWSAWADGGVYDSPYVKVKDGRMTVTDGHEGYVVDFTGQRPVWRELPRDAAK
jgi:hypothetical protein